MSNDEIGSRDGGSPKIAILAGAVIALFLCNVYLIWRVHGLETTASQWRAAASQQISDLRAAFSTNAANQTNNLHSLESELATARKQATASAGQARIEAQKHAEELAKQLADAQQQQQQQLTQVQQSAATANTKIDGVSSDVAATKSDVAATKSQLDNTVADLKRVTGDMGVLSDRIATNGQELGALRKLGERNYFEFNVAKSKLPQKVANIELWVKKTDPKRNRFTVSILADDKRVEKRDRTVNEPVQFYVAKAHQPYEIVVNEVKKDRIIGYLATPKVELARN